MIYLKKLISWLAAGLFFVWAGVRLVLDVVGRSTFKDDLDQLMDDGLPQAAAWLFTTPWWVPGLIGFGMAVFIVWISLPKSDGLKGLNSETPKHQSAESFKNKFGEEIAMRRFRLADYVSDLEEKALRMSATEFRQEVEEPNVDQSILCANGPTREKWRVFEISAKHVSRLNDKPEIALDATFDEVMVEAALHHKVKAKMRNAAQELINELVPLS